MAEQELMRRRLFAVSMDAAVRFGTNEVRVGAAAPDFELPDLPTGEFLYLIAAINLVRFRGE